MPYYIAYGSNLWRSQMFQRCPQAQPVRKIVLPNRRLIFRRYADLEDAAGETVDCALYRVTRACLDRLDFYEGVRAGSYFRHTIRIQTADLGVINAITYLNARPGFAPPTDEYVYRLRAGYRDWKVPSKRLERALTSAGYLPPDKRPKAPTAPRIAWDSARDAEAIPSGGWDAPNTGWYDYGDTWVPPRDLRDDPEDQEDAGSWRSYRAGR